MKANRKGLESYARRILDKHYPNMETPDITIDKKSKRFAATAYSFKRISMTKWIMKDLQEARSTIRHELAHNIFYWLREGRYILHGKEFKQILRRIAPKTWRYDMHWNMTPAISQAREKEGILEHRYQSMPWRVFTCGNPDCPANPRHLWSWKRIPSYIIRGLFKRCPDCDCPTIIEIADKKVQYRSVH